MSEAANKEALLEEMRQTLADIWPRVKAHLGGDLKAAPELARDFLDDLCGMLEHWHGVELTAHQRSRVRKLAERLFAHRQLDPTGAKLFETTLKRIMPEFKQVEQTGSVDHRHSVVRLPATQTPEQWNAQLQSDPGRRLIEQD